MVHYLENLKQKADSMKEIITHHEKETEAFGRELAKLISPPAVLCLYGELGAGKTALVRGLAEGMGLNCTVSSPTFTIVNEYLGERELIHFDMYRLNGADELFDIGWEDYLRRNAVLAVEWSENVENILPKDKIEVSIDGVITPKKEEYTIIGGGSNAEQYKYL